MSRHIAINQSPDTLPVPDPVRESMRGWDDLQVIQACRLPHTKAAAEIELASRRRFEAAWSGEWTSGPKSEVPPPFKKKFRQFL